ncbi:MAG: S8 family serine peptidase [archaeon]
MRRLIFLVLVLGLIGFVCAGGINNDNIDVIVKMKSGIEMKSFMKTMNTESEKVLNDFDNQIDNRFTSFDGFSAKVSLEEYEELKNNPNVESVNIDYKISTHLINATEIMNATDSWELKSSDIGLSGTGQTICVIDTGINYSHSDFGGCTSEEFTSGNCDKVIGGYDIADGDSDVMDYVGHGTHVAGIVAANGLIKGIAPNASLVIMKVFTDAGAGSGSDVISAIEWCTNNASEFNISVITVSIGLVYDNLSSVLYSSYCDDDLSEYKYAIDAAVAKNISVLFSAGNDGNSDKIGAPACVSSSIPISSATKGDIISSFSDRSNLVKLFATGGTLGTSGDVVCSDPSNPSNNYICSTGYHGGYLYKSGTSMSTPMVAGAIAILNQYLDINEQTKSPSEIEDVLYGTGLQFNESENNFSRIDVYSAILSLDIDSPNITLVSPVDGHVNSSVNQSFICNVSDWQLKNLTLSIWNSSGDLINSSSVNVSGVQNSSSFSLEGMAEGEYNWSCFGYDVKNNLGIVSANFSLTVGGIEVSLNSPADESYTNVNTSSFNCSATSESAYELSNMSFRIWNSSSDLVYNETKNISGFENVSIFNYTFLYDDDYLWECVALNNNSEEGDGVNYSLTYDSAAPNITLTSLPSSETSNSISKDFGFNVSDENIANCSLIVNDIVVLTNSSVDVSVGQLFSRTFTPGTYAWNINCSDLAGNVNSSVENNFVITAVPSSGGGGGGGSSSSSPKIFVALVDNLFSDDGYTQVLKVKEKISFSANSGSHSLSVLKVGSDYVSILIQSEPVELNLYVGQEEKFNLSSSDYYDLYVRLNSISGESVNVTVKRIFELIENESFVDSVDVSEMDDLIDAKVSSDKKREYFSWIVVVLILIVVVFGNLDKKKKLKREKTRKKHGKQNKKVKAKAKRSR